MAVLVYDQFKEALREQGIEPKDMLDPVRGRNWILGQYPDGTWMAVTAGGSVQWWRGEGDWRVEWSNNTVALRSIRRGPPAKFDHLVTGLPEDWMSRLQERQ